MSSATAGPVVMIFNNQDKLAPSTCCGPESASNLLMSVSGAHTRLSNPTIGIPFTRPERERRLDTGATSTNE
jgi:hypothetical protein